MESEPHRFEEPKEVPGAGVEKARQEVPERGGNGSTLNRATEATVGAVSSSSAK